MLTAYAFYQFQGCFCYEVHRASDAEEKLKSCQEFAQFNAAFLRQQRDSNFGLLKFGFKIRPLIASFRLRTPLVALLLRASSLFSCCTPPFSGSCGSNANVN